MLVERVGNDGLNLACEHFDFRRQKIDEDVDHLVQVGGRGFFDVPAGSFEARSGAPDGVDGGGV